MKKYYTHDLWENSKKWIEKDKEQFENEVIKFRKDYNIRYDFKENKTIYYFDHKTYPTYDWKVEVTI